MLYEIPSSHLFSFYLFFIITSVLTPQVRDDFYVVAANDVSFLDVRSNDRAALGAAPLLITAILPPGVLPAEGTVTNPGGGIGGGNFNLDFIEGEGEEEGGNRKLEESTTTTNKKQKKRAKEQDQVSESIEEEEESPVIESESIEEEEEGPVIAEVQPGQRSLNGQCNPTSNRERVRYIPDPGYTGPDQCAYRACDTTGVCGEALITFLVVELEPTLSPTLSPVTP